MSQYLFRGPRLWYRHVTARDVADVYEICEQWPADHLGPYTYERAVQDCSRYMEKAKRIHRPVTWKSNFTEVLLACEVDKQGIETVIGINWTEIVGRRMNIRMRAIKPSCQGKGFSNDMDIDNQTYVFEILKIQEATFQVFSDVPQLVNKIGRVGKRFKQAGSIVPGDQTLTKKELMPASFSLADFRKLRENGQELVTFKWLGDPVQGVSDRD